MPTSAFPIGSPTMAGRKVHLPSVSVVICVYTEARWDALAKAIASLQQQVIPTDVIVVVDHNAGLFQRAREAFPDVTVVTNTGPRGLSGARNSGVEAANGEVIAFLDDDAVAGKHWLHYLLAPFTDDRVIAVGGAVQPDWEAPPPQWFPEEFYWVVGCSYRGLPLSRGEIRNPIGANMAFRREVFQEIGGFDAGVGRIGTIPAGCEETELCIRIHQRWPDAAIIQEPRAIVMHHVPRQRMTWHYFRSRCYAEGRSKAMVSRLVGAGDGLSAERSYTLKVLPSGAVRALGYGVRHADPGSGARAFAIGAGLALTSLGYIGGRLSPGPPSTPSAPLFRFSLAKAERHQL